MEKLNYMLGISICILLVVKLAAPVAITLKLPVSKRAFFNIHGGIWTWSFWHDIDYDTPFLSVDYAIRFPFYHDRLQLYMGLGLAGFFKDNPKDPDDYDAAAAVRLPLGIEFFRTDHYTISFELAPIYQFAPAYESGPYGIELNGGLILECTF